jgi:uncharacterized protein (TIGR03437 family)
MKLAPDGRMVYSQYIGGSNADYGSAIAVDGDGNAYVTGRTWSADFPTTAGSLLPAQPGTPGSASNFVAKISGGVIASISAASFQKGSLAPGSLVTGYGVDFPANQTVGDGTATTLGMLSVQVTDATGAKASAPLFFVSPTQINFLAPEGLKPGLATVNVLRLGKLVAIGSAQIDSVAPGLFSAAMNGKGAAAAMVIRTTADGQQTYQYVYQTAASGTISFVPVNLGADSDQSVLVLYGTGVRHATSLAGVTATVGGVAANVLYAGSQNQYPGLDQVNVLLPHSLAGRGVVDVQLTVDGKAANTLQLQIQ